MNQPGPFQLTQNGVAFQIVGPGTLIGDFVEGLDGVQAITFQAQFLYGSGGSSVTAYLQTSIDQGNSWIDIAAVQFTTVGGAEMLNLSGLTPKTTPIIPTNQALTPGQTVDGILGDRFRAVVVVAGAYGSSSLLNITGCAR
ncbi:hypothetical protein OGR47_02710 [Methylocystis sp. MJC1]|uniref:hypothetical protein n=1 Tax=Methylocystis sp. MJC1 TaxID=2654282 RepID=UPI0013EC8733|nr:hypothetical protein [Methylocystis sp. MJC1]KAF2991152.1 hypothetical protein MJC1_01885 [Methylocystis sp. MJC1]MBU6525925.1 hypothetical protein [Methylocystis sp. MJC1]UZX12391.1 hypothetical protein OGR47_02710 [Methylocystis sp. MJC1]